MDNDVQSAKAKLYLNSNWPVNKTHRYVCRLGYLSSKHCVNASPALCHLYGSIIAITVSKCSVICLFIIRAA